MPNTITLKVTLKTTNGVTNLDVDQANNANHVPQNAQATTIEWKLEGNASSGSFQMLDGTPPGIKWCPPAPSGTIFGSFSRTSNGNTLTVPDLNVSTSTQGTWTYQLNATVNGTMYSTIATTPTATTTNPTIRNT